MKERLDFDLTVRVSFPETGLFQSWVRMQFRETILVVDDLEGIYPSLLYNATNISNRMIRHEEI